MPAPPPQPSPDQLAAASGRTVPDLVRPGLAVLLCGINPSLWSGAVGLHFAAPSNRLWPTLHASGWTPTSCTTTGLRAGLPRVAALAERVRPGWVAFLGLSSYRTATGDRRAAVGPQERLVGGVRVWLLPNPSGLKASWQLPRLAEAYGALREAATG